MGLPASTSGILTLVRDNGANTVQELFRLERNTTSAAGTDTLSTSALVRFNNAGPSDRLRILAAPDPRLSQGSVSFLGGQNGGYATSFSGFSLTAAFGSTPVTFDRTLRNIGVGGGGIIFTEGELSIRQRGLYFFTITATLTIVQGLGIDLRLIACGRTFSFRRLSNGGFTPQSDTIQLSAFVSCSVGDIVLVERSNSENIHALRLFGFLYDPRGANVTWNLDQQQFADSAQLPNDFSNVPYTIVDNSNFRQGVNQVSGGSLEIVTSGVYFIHLHTLFGWQFPLSVSVERLPLGALPAVRLFTMQRSGVESQGFVDSMSRTGIFELTRGDVIRVNLVRGVLYTAISSTDQGSRISGGLLFST